MHSNLDSSAPPDFTTIAAALEFIEAEGLQAPPLRELEEIIDAAVQATGFSRLSPSFPCKGLTFESFQRLCRSLCKPRSRSW